MRREVASSLVLVVFGFGFLAHNLRYPFDSWANPGPGVFPFIVGTALVLLAAALFFQAIGQSRSPDAGTQTRKRIASVREWLRKNGEVGPILLILVIALYLLTVKWIGFFVANFIFVVVSSRLMGAKGWRNPVALSAAVNLFCYGLFAVWLNLVFPRGLFF